MSSLMRTVQLDYMVPKLLFSPEILASLESLSVLFEFLKHSQCMSHGKSLKLKRTEV